jgi:hypothetical protein
VVLWLQWSGGTRTFPLSPPTPYPLSSYLVATEPPPYRMNFQEAEITTIRAGQTQCHIPPQAQFPALDLHFPWAPGKPDDKGRYSRAAMHRLGLSGLIWSLLEARSKTTEIR